MNSTAPQPTHRFEWIEIHCDGEATIHCACGHRSDDDTSDGAWQRHGWHVAGKQTAA